MRRLTLAALAISLALCPALGRAQPAPPRPAAASPAAGPAPAARDTPRVDINTATVDRLDTLPGIGPALAAKIVKARPYQEAADLVAKKAIPQSTFDGLKDSVAVVDVNKASAPEMAAILPGIGAAYSQAIVDARKKAGGTFRSLQELVTSGAIPQGTLERIRAMVTVG